MPCRVVYLPTSYLYANKCQVPLTALLKALREEIYLQPLSSINFAENNDTVAPTDMKRPYSTFLKVLNYSAQTWEEYFRLSWIHQKANKVV